MVHHTDAECEYTYDRQSSIGRLDKAPDAAALDRWTMVDMKGDWKIVVPAGRYVGSKYNCRLDRAVAGPLATRDQCDQMLKGIAKEVHIERISRTMLASIRRRCVSCNVVLSLCMLARNSRRRYSQPMCRPLRRPSSRHHPHGTSASCPMAGSSR